MDSLVYADGTWHEGDPPLIGALSQSYMHGTAVFDGARLFNDCVPDLGRHCERLLRSAAVMGLDQPVDAATVESLAREGARRFETGAELYIRPSLYAARGFLTPEPGSTRFLLSLMRMAMPAAHGRSIAVSPFRRPGPDMAPTEAKASCLYPNGSRALQDAERRGFDNALMLDGDGNVAELASANIWLGRNGVAITPVWNRTFLNGITKLRVSALLGELGIDVVEQTVSLDDVMGADEVFSTGNWGKVLPITRVDDHEFPVGPLYRAAREAYWAYAKTEPL